MFRWAKKLSILLAYFAATVLAAVCVRSFFVDERVSWRHLHAVTSEATDDHLVAIVADTVAWGHGSMFVGQQMTSPWELDPIEYDCALGFEYSRLSDAPVRLWNDITPRPFGRLFEVYEYGEPIALENPSHGHGVGFPLWALVAMTAPPPLWDARRRMARWQQTRRRAAGLCVACGYDLRCATSCCPECGTPTPAIAGPAGGE